MSERPEDPHTEVEDSDPVVAPPAAETAHEAAPDATETSAWHPSERDPEPATEPEHAGGAVAAGERWSAPATDPESPVVEAAPAEAPPLVDAPPPVEPFAAETPPVADPAPDVVVRPVPAGPAPEPTASGWTPPADPPETPPPSSPTDRLAAVSHERPEALVGGAFVGGVLIAQILKRLGS